MRPVARAVLGGAGVLAGMWALALLTAPPAPAVLEPAGEAPVRGAFHVHTSRSDGGGDLDAVATAAAGAGLDFVIVTDHGDGTRPPEPPAYRAGVLIVDAVEVSTAGGHVVALGLDAAPYPLAGEAPAVVEDVRRLGGLAVAAHPDSPRETLSWRAGDLPVDGVEWLNVDSAWRDDAWPLLAATLLRYPARPASALAALFDRPVEALAWWDRLTTAGRRVVGLPALDAHARLGPGGGQDGAASPGLPVPSYAATFRLMSLALDGAVFTGDAEADAVTVLEAIGAGAVYSVIDAVATPGVLRVGATRDGETARMGEVLPSGRPFDLVASLDGAGDARIDLLRDGEVVASGPGPELRYRADGAPGVYRVEVHLPGAPGEPPVPWMVANPVYVLAAGQEAPDEGPATLVDVQPAPPRETWRVEASPVSEGAIDGDLGLAGEPVTLLRYALSGRLSESPFTAFVVPVGGLFDEGDGVAFTVRSDWPMRVDVQVRTPTPVPGEGRVGERWHRSVWADTTARAVVVTLDELVPLGPTREASPDAARIDSLMLVVDTVNTPVGTGGRVWISDLRLGRDDTP